MKNSNIYKAITQEQIESGEFGVVAFNSVQIIIALNSTGESIGSWQDVYIVRQGSLWVIVTE